jgi:fibro-slime domain-containing protein
LFGNGFSEQNFYFTYEIVATFTAAPGQFIEFKGSDDCWIFIQGPGYTAGKLLIDHGGIAANREQFVTLDRYSGLVHGAEYKMYMFYAERSQPQSQFALKTNILMQSDVDNSIFAAFD